jgi:serine/threonine protein phosphatase PrpC
MRATSRVGLHGVRVTSICGINRRDVMEDAHAIQIDDAYQPAYVGVFDGHCGGMASKWAAKHLHEHVLSNGKLNDAFLDADEALRERSTSCFGLFDTDRSGTTAAIALLTHNGSSFNLTTAHCGDSRIVTCDDWNVETQTFDTLVETIDHKPGAPAERQRIQALGGSVSQFEGRGPLRVAGDLSVSRSLGDFRYKRYIPSTPDVSSVRKLSRQAQVVLACDGLFDVVTGQDVADVLAQAAEPRDAVTRLYELAVTHGSLDNITILLVDFVDDPLPSMQQQAVR